MTDVEIAGTAAGTIAGITAVTVVVTTSEMAATGVAVADASATVPSTDPPEKNFSPTAIHNGGSNPQWGVASRMQHPFFRYSNVCGKHRRRCRRHFGIAVVRKTDNAWTNDPYIPPTYCRSIPPEPFCVPADIPHLPAVAFYD